MKHHLDVVKDLFTKCLVCGKRFTLVTLMVKKDLEECTPPTCPIHPSLEELNKAYDELDKGPSCECGADKLQSPNHSTWCSKYG